MASTINVKVRFDAVRVTDSITRPANATQYAAGDVIAEVTTNDNFLFSGIFEKGRPQGLSALISGAWITSSANQGTKLDAELWLFHSAVAEDGDNAAFTPTDAELATCVGVIDFAVADWKEGDATSGAGGNAICFASLTNGGIPVNGVDENLYGVLVARNTYTPVSGEILTINLLVSQD